MQLRKIKSKQPVGTPTKGYCFIRKMLQHSSQCFQMTAVHAWLWPCSLASSIWQPHYNHRLVCRSIFHDKSAPLNFASFQTILQLPQQKCHCQSPGLLSNVNKISEETTQVSIEKIKLMSPQSAYELLSLPSYKAKRIHITSCGWCCFTDIRQTGSAIFTLQPACSPNQIVSILYIWNRKIF